MGICQCLEANTVCINYELTPGNYHITQNKSSDDENGDEVGLIKSMKGNKKNFFGPKNAAFTNFKDSNPKNRKEILEALLTLNESNSNNTNKSEILFEEFSYISKTNESVIDYYQNSKVIFDLINNIRMHPQKYINTITALINKVGNIYNYASNNSNISNLNLSEGNLNTNNSANYSYNSPLIVGNSDFSLEWQLIKLNELKSFLLKLSDNTKGDVLMWSEKVYLSAYEYLIEVEENSFKDDIESRPEYKSSSLRISEKLKINNICIEFNLNGLYSPELTVLYLLFENIERLKQILVDNYEYSAVCVFPTQRQNKARTLFYFVKKSLKLVKITGINPFTQNPHDLFLNELLFSRINYKHLIIDGFYQSDGKVLNVSFNLINGETRQEIFSIN